MSIDSLDDARRKIDSVREVRKDIVLREQNKIISEISNTKPNGNMVEFEFKISMTDREFADFVCDLYMQKGVFIERALIKKSYNCGMYDSSDYYVSSIKATFVE